VTKEIVFLAKDQSCIPTELGKIGAMLYDKIDGGPVEVALRSPTQKRNNDQNAKTWPMLQDIVRHKPEWPRPDGTMCKMNTEKYKGMLVSSLFDFELVCNSDMSGIVGFGTSTSKLSKKNFCLLIDFIYAFGASHGVQWSEKAQTIYDTYREAQQ